MDPDQLRTVIQAAISNALAEQTAQSQLREQALRLQIEELAGRVAAVSTASAPAQTPQIKTYEAIEIREDIQCNEPSDAVKCLPEFAGTQESYVSWRQAAVAAPAFIKRSLLLGVKSGVLLMLCYLRLGLC